MDGGTKRIRFCAPGIKVGPNDVPTCYTRKQLIILAREINNGGGGGGERKKLIKTSGSKAAIWQQIRDAMGDRCRYESCWMEKADLPYEMKVDMAKRFLPKRPKTWDANIHTWLSNFDIDAIMELYEEKHRDFSYLGTVTADCPVSYKCELSGFDMCDLYKKGITRAGIIYNLDTHEKGGSHWVAVFIDLKHGRELSYFDSYGMPPPPLIRKFLERQYRALNAAAARGEFGGRGGGPAVKYVVNKKRHQRGSSECGVFSINYILQKINGKKMSQISRVRITDAQMNLLRRNLFRH